MFQEALTQRLGELAALYRFTEQLQVSKTLAEIYQAALTAITQALRCDRASILLCDHAGIMRFVAWRGLSDEYREAVDGHSPWHSGVKAPEPVIISDIAGAELSESLKKSISAEGIGGIAFIPLITDDKLIGKFMTYYSLPHHLTEEELSLAQAIARQLAIGIARKAAEAKLRDSEERFRLMSEQAPVMIWMSDAQGQCLHLNRLLRAFWAVEEEHLSRFNWQDTIHPEDAEEIRRQVVYAIARRSNFSIKARYRNADGQYRVLQTEAHTRVSGHGEFLGMIGVNVDVTEREEAERALRASELRFRLAVEAAPSGMVMTNAEGQITLSNAHLERLLGYSRDELIGQPVETLVPARLRDRHPAFREG